VDQGIKKAFKGGWGAQAHTKRVGIVQDLNRLSFNAALCHLRKINLPLDSSSKVVGPRILHNSHWGYFDFIDTPDGANIGLHKTFAMSAYMTRGYSREHIIQWLRKRVGMLSITDCTPVVLSTMTKVFVNGHWAGVIDTPIECVSKMRLYRRNGLIPLHTSVAFNIRNNAVEIYTDAGRFTRPIFYKDDITGKWAFALSKTAVEKTKTGNFTWEEMVSGFNPKRADVKYSTTDVVIRELGDLYPGVDGEKEPTKLDRFLKHKAVIEYIDPNETEHSLIAQSMKDLNPANGGSASDKMDRYTHMEIHHSFLFGIMCNQSIFAETNPAARISFSCSQSRQACSIYHSNFHCRMDKTAIVLNYGQTPLLKTRLLQHIDKEEHPYGENVIVAIMCYTGYNVEDAILVNEGAIQRGLFNTTYYTVYSEHEERKRGQDGSTLVTDKRFSNIESEPSVVGLKAGHDYSKLDRNGLIKENTVVDDKTIIIGLTSNSTTKAGVRVDASKTTKKGQLGVVDKAFITEGEEGERIAKVRIREIRIPNLGDKMASRAGQKGVVGLVIPEKDMPFTKDGLKPDLIINPHALPTRQTIGHLVECLLGKVCTMYGGFSDCTAFNNEGSKAALYGRLLPEVGFHSTGHDILYNGMTGDQIETEIFIGPNYYMRLKHMVKDKINFRALGPRTALTKQPVSGRANDGGLRIGEMERDSIIGHGINDFLRESMMERGDEYQMVVCNTTGTLAVYNRARDLFMSPMADGPLRFFKSESGSGYALDTMTKYGRRFSIVSVPYSLKLLMQELAAINIQLRVITEDNLHQIESMSYSGHLNKLTLREDMTPDKFVTEMRHALAVGEKPLTTPSSMNMPEAVMEDKLVVSPQYPDVSPAFEPEEIALGPEEGIEPEEVALGPEEVVLPQYPDVSSEPGYGVPLDNGIPPDTYDLKTNNQEEMIGGGGGAYGINDFELGENVYFRGSTDLGLPYNQAWSVAKKGGMLLTIKSDRMMGGGGENLTNSDFTQIVKAGELIKPAAFQKWEQQRAGMRELAETRHAEAAAMMAPQHSQQQPMGYGMTFAPTIKLVGGNDYSKNDGGGDDNGSEPKESTFSSLVIPSQNGGGGEKDTTLPLEKSENPKGKTIMGGLADFGSLVINKIL
jgi:DNA-directed RNA polymerase II subunit RPB2